MDAEKETTINWSTRDELLYLKNIGRSYAKHGASLVDYLKGYIAAAYKRTDWGSMNRGEVVFTAQQMLAKALVLK